MSLVGLKSIVKPNFFAKEASRGVAQIPLVCNTSTFYMMGFISVHVGGYV